MLAKAAIEEQPDLAHLRERLQQGPLTHAERARVWPALLRSCSTAEGSANEQPDDKTCQVPPALLELLNPLSGRADEEEILFQSNEAEGPEPVADEAEQATRLATLFCRQHLSWMWAQDSQRSQGVDVRTFSAMSQSLMYHFPQVACALRSVAVAEHNVEVEVKDLPSLLCAACNTCGYAVSIHELLFEVDADKSFCSSSEGADDGKTELLLLCDLVAVEGQDLLLFFAVLVLLSEIMPEPGCTFAELEDRLREAIALAGFARRPIADIVRILGDALLLLQATPHSLKCAVRGEGGDAWSNLPVCTIAPDEVLRHTHGGSREAWRLIVVDARMRAREFCLPVCVRLSPARHSRRLDEARQLPDDNALHLCLVGDGPPGRSDGASELAFCLVFGKGMWRKHVSILEGGWPALQSCAHTLNLELLPVCADLDDGVASSVVAEDAVDEVVKHLSIAGEKASAAAQSWLGGASEALSFLAVPVQQVPREQAQADSDTSPQALDDFLKMAESSGSSAWKQASQYFYMESPSTSPGNSPQGHSFHLDAPQLPKKKQSASSAYNSDVPAPLPPAQPSGRMPRIDQSAWSSMTRAVDYLEGLISTDDVEEHHSEEPVVSGDSLQQSSEERAGVKGPIFSGDA